VLSKWPEPDDFSRLFSRPGRSRPLRAHLGHLADSVLDPPDYGEAPLTAHLADSVLDPPDYGEADNVVDKGCLSPWHLMMGLDRRGLLLAG